MPHEIMPHEMKTFGLIPAVGLLLLAAVLAERAPADDAADALQRFTIPLIDLAADKHRQVVVDREEGRYLGHPTTVLLEDGKTMLCVYPKGHGRGAIVYKRSTDGGLTWSDRLPTPDSWATSLEVPTLHRVVDAQGTRRIIMFSGLYPCRMAVSEDDGKQLAVLLRENLRRKNSHIMFSNDEGRTWTEPREMPAALNGDRHTGKYCPDGRLFISFRDRSPRGVTSPTEGDWVAWVGTYEDLVKGRQGQYRVRLMDNRHGWDCAYPGVEVLPDGTIVTTTYGHWTEGEPPYIVSVRLKLDELDSRSHLPPGEG